MFSNALSLARTKNDISILSDEIDILRNTLYQPEGSKGKDKVRATTLQSVEKDLKQGELEKEDYFIGLTKALDELQEVVIEIALEPTEELIEEVSQWVKANIGPSVVINFKINPALLAGATISFKGKFMDYSLSSQLTKRGDYLSTKNEGL